MRSYSLQALQHRHRDHAEELKRQAEVSLRLRNPPHTCGRHLSFLLFLLFSAASCPTPSFTLSVSAASDPASFSLSFFNPFCSALPLPLHSPPSLSHSLSIALFLSSFHAVLGLPKRLGLNGENLLWYNELEERKRGGGLEKGGRMEGVFDTGGWGGETSGDDRGMQMQGWK